MRRWSALCGTAGTRPTERHARPHAVFCRIPERPRHQIVRHGAHDKRGPDGRWLLENTHPGAVHVRFEEPDGTPSRWNTLRALRVLRWYDGYPHAVAADAP